MPSGSYTAWTWSALAVAGLIVGAVVYSSIDRGPPAPTKAVAGRPSPRLQPFGNYTLWWDGTPEEVQSGRVDTGTETNIHPDDYIGPAACQSCHPKQHEGWSNHAHRWMNALADDSTVKGDFSDRKVSFLGGEVTFTKEGDAYRMRLERGDIHREYTIDQTIGSRYYQYYVGIQLKGPEPPEHPVYSDGHVLPFGYWLDRKEWVPAVHVFGDERSETKLHDPFLPRRLQRTKDFSQYADNAPDLYRSQCNFCHTTFAVGDMLIRHPQLLSRHVPRQLDLSFPEYLMASHPAYWSAGQNPWELPDDRFASILKEFRSFEASKEAITLGVSCEACHLGAKEHAQGKWKRPQFFPRAPELSIKPDQTESPLNFDFGRTHDNVNWACGRCHAGHRPTFAAGMATWNSTEYSDAMLGGCYSKLTCVECHNPHETIGKAWARTAVEDDNSCLKCHETFRADDARTAHTHHSAASEGSHCMNCHMPRINEGLQDVVRTHTIFSPTNRAMIESNQPNACNQCHVEQPIEWTLGYLDEWYGAKYAKDKIKRSYPLPGQPATIGWLYSDNQAVRMAAADSLTRAKATWALPNLLRSLDDTYILNRQFARIGLEAMLGIRLADFGYGYFETPAERAEAINELRAKLLPAKPAEKSQP